jgi:hypothetical protein
MLYPRVEGDRVWLGERLAVSFHRTLRVPDDGRVFPLPAGLGRFPLVEVEGEIALPIHRHEAMWIGIAAAPWKPNALKVRAGGINAISGLPDTGTALRNPQDYLVCPPQPWLDGFNAGGGTIRQFQAAALGAGVAIEALHGLREQGGITLLAFEPKPGRFPDAPPPQRGPMRLDRPREPDRHEMAFGPGGLVRQKLYPDPHGPDTWCRSSAVQCRLVLVEATWLAARTGRHYPSPIDADTYAAAGLPWFELDDGAEGAVEPHSGPPPGRAKTH